MFLPGGRGTERGARRVLARYLSEGQDVDRFRLVVPYAEEDMELLAEMQRMPTIRSEVLECFGGDAAKVHIAGTSNGGNGAFSRPHLFVALRSCACHHKSPNTVSCRNPALKRLARLPPARRREAPHPANRQSRGHFPKQPPNREGAD